MVSVIVMYVMIINITITTATAIINNSHHQPRTLPTRRDISSSAFHRQAYDTAMDMDSA